MSRSPSISRRLSILAVATTLLGGLLTLTAPPDAIAATLPSGIIVSVGYADGLRSGGFYPSPWSGDPGVIFEGCQSGCTYDAGAVLVTNTTSSTVTATSLNVTLGTCTFAIWPGNISLPAGSSVIYTQTSATFSAGCPTDGTFDTSDVGPNSSDWAGNCTQSGIIPQVALTINGISQTISDSQQVLNTGGMDLAACAGSPNESKPWTQLWPGPPDASFQNGGGNPTADQYAVCVCADPVDVATGDYWRTYHELSIPGRGVPLDFSLTYNSLAAGQNSPLGFGWASPYLMNLAVNAGAGTATLTQENGSTVPFTLSAGTWSPPSYVPGSLLHNNDGSWTFTRWHTGVRYTFAATGQLVTIADRNGYLTRLNYNASWQLTAVTDAAGRALTVLPDASGHLLRVTDPIGRQASFGYDGSGNLTTITDVNGGATRLGYDSGHHQTTITDPRTNTVTNTYESLGRVTAQTDALSRSTSFGYNGGTTTVTDPLGVQTLQQNSNGEPVNITRAVGSAQIATWRYTYDAKTLGRTSRTDPNENLSSYTYNSRADRTSVTDPLGRATTFGYNSLDEPTRVLDPAGISTTAAYDTSGNLLSVTRAGGSLTQSVSFGYGDPTHPGDVTVLTDPTNNTTHVGYSTTGDVTSVTDPLGDKTTYRFDPVGRRTAKVSPNGYAIGPAIQYTTSYGYDPFGDLTSVTDPLGHRTSTSYDANRNVISRTDPAGNTTSYAYDAANELTRQTRVDGSTIASGYDADGRQTSQTDALGAITSYGYDPLGRQTSVTDPDHRTTSHGYDRVGNLTTITDPAGKVTTRSYDAASQLTGISYSDGTTPNVSYAYNLHGNVLAETDGTVFARRYAYDSLGRLNGTTDTKGTSTFAIAYTRDTADRVTSQQFTLSGDVARTFTRTYDAAGRMSSVNDGAGVTTGFAYDGDSNIIGTTFADDNIIGITFANSSSVAYTFNAADQLINTTASVIGGAQLSYPSPRNTDALVTADNQSGTAAGPSQAFSYDALLRLAGVGSSAGSPTSYAYDAADRLTQWITPEAAHAFSYDPSGQLTSETTQQGTSVVTTTFGYDTQGNRTTQTDTLPGGAPASTATYTYDQANRLVRYDGPPTTAFGQAGSTPGQTRTYSYDSHGLRTDLGWDLAEGIPTIVYDGKQTFFLTGPDGLPVEEVDICPCGAGGASPIFYLHDHLGSTRALISADGALVASYAYDAYGNTVSSTASGQLNPFGFAGQYTDPNSGLIYMRARWYDPATGQFLTRDPLFGASGSSYSYANDSPLNASDPTGMFACGSEIGPCSPGASNFWDVVSRLAGTYQATPDQIVSAILLVTHRTTIEGLVLDPSNGAIYQDGCPQNVDYALGFVIYDIAAVENHDLGNDQLFRNGAFVGGSDVGLDWEPVKEITAFSVGCFGGVAEGAESLGMAATFAVAAVPGIDIGEGAVALGACILGGAGGVGGFNVFNPSGPS
jgi:RHS repeat-associated protein